MDSTGPKEVMVTVPRAPWRQSAATAFEDRTILKEVLVVWATATPASSTAMSSAVPTTSQSRNVVVVLTRSRSFRSCSYQFPFASVDGDLR